MPNTYYKNNHLVLITVAEVLLRLPEEAHDMDDRGCHFLTLDWLRIGILHFFAFDEFFDALH